jgi:hypothetical protein
MGRRRVLAAIAAVVALAALVLAWGHSERVTL